MFDQQPPARCHAGGPVTRRCQCRLSLCPGPAPARGRGPGRRVGRAARQHTQFDKVYSAGQKRKYGAINRGDMYEINQG